MKNVVTDIGEGIGTASHGGHFIHGGSSLITDVPTGHQCHDLLAQYVDGVAGYARLLHDAVEHAARHHRGTNEIGPEFGKYPSFAWFAHLMASPADALQPTGH